VPRHDFILPPLSPPVCLSGALRCQTDRGRVSVVAARRVSHGIATQPYECIRTMGASVSKMMCSCLSRDCCAFEFLVLSMPVD
jgi:hypothetical protein